MQTKNVLSNMSTYEPNNWGKLKNSSEVSEKRKIKLPPQ